MAASYPWNSTYAFAENRVVDGVDLEGKEWQNFKSKFKDPGELKIKLPTANAQYQHYEARVENSKKSFDQIKSDFLKYPHTALSNSKAAFHPPVDGKGKPAPFQVGNYIKIDINGPLNNAYVKIIGIENKEGYVSATFATMEGHMENGVIKFSITDEGNGKVDFNINSRSEVDMAMAPEGYSRKEQAKSWIEVLDNAVEYTGGKAVERKAEVLPQSSSQQKQSK